MLHGITVKHKVSQRYYPTLPVQVRRRRALCCCWRSGGLLVVVVVLLLVVVVLLLLLLLLLLRAMSDCEDGELQGSDQEDSTTNPLATDGADAVVALAAAGAGGVAASDLLTVRKDAKQAEESAAAEGGPQATAAAAAAQRPAAPLGWFEGGVWAWLDETAIVWAGHGLLTLPMPLAIGHWLWSHGLGILEVGGGVCLGVLLFAWSLNWALASLRRAVRPTTGSLPQLVAASPDSGEGKAPTIAEESWASLVRWRRGAYGVAALWALAWAVVLLPTITHEIAAGQLMAVGVWLMFLLNFAGIGPLFAAWYVSLRLGCALAGDDAERSSPAPSDATLPAGEWERTVRGPMMAVADETMPALSEWGEPLAVLTAGLLCLALGLVDFGLRVYNLTQIAPVLVLVLLAMPSLWLVPATVSTACERMTESLNNLRKHSAAGNQSRISTLEAYLKGRNREQGVGFEVHGTMLNRAELKTLVGKTYAGVAFLWVLFGPETGGFSGGSVDLHDYSGRCREGWAYADGSCFRAFGVSVEPVGAEETAEWKTWPEAEEACQALGGHLAVISSQAQQDTAVALSGELSVWIGLHDLTEEDEFVWSDGEPLGAYDNWGATFPDEGGSVGVQCAEDTPGQDCVIAQSVIRHAWNDFPCATSTGGNFTSRADNIQNVFSSHEGGCGEFRLPYICSKSPLPGADCSAA
eukprot:COSAG02_NODE_1124_length_14441_cov_21.457607_14_plen_693_part_00